MKIKSAVFVESNTDWRKCPEPIMPEYAFIGRSNVGKSSVINMLVNNKKLAKTSSTPGKTQLINHFLINESWYLVDLPGYGYAKVSRKDRAKFGQMIESYILNRKNLVNVFVLVDSRHEPQKNDLSFMEFLGESQIPFSIVMTKIDKINSAKLGKNLMKYKNEMLKTWAELPPFYTTSATSKIGAENILHDIGVYNQQLEDVFKKD
ncbi:YihA family ribosome biogenesis GTP-binding protein [Flavobacteriaceae bacterium Ap0902]|nr:YihA family ribosome biogenesis GTP-binding protein [Flavobacteriaceae bacterium Ap0902]